MSRVPKRVREAALIIAWGNGYEVWEFNALPDWYQESCIMIARDVLDNIKKYNKEMSEQA